MARFMATLQGNRGRTSRLGSSNSGIEAKINGWNLGIQVTAIVNEAGGDAFVVYLTGGSNGKAVPKLIGSFTEMDLEP